MMQSNYSKQSIGFKTARPSFMEPSESELTLGKQPTSSDLKSPQNMNVATDRRREKGEFGSYLMSHTQTPKNQIARVFKANQFDRQRSTEVLDHII